MGNVLLVTIQQLTGTERPQPRKQYILLQTITGNVLLVTIQQLTGTERPQPRMQYILLQIITDNTRGYLI